MTSWLSNRHLKQLASKALRQKQPKAYPGVRCGLFGLENVAGRLFQKPAGCHMLMSYREALNQAMREEMRRDSRIFLIGEEVGYYQGAFKVSKGFVEEFGPQRVVDTPITEGGFTGLAIGAAMAGLHPIVELMTMNFGIWRWIRSSIMPPKFIICQEGSYRCRS